MKWMLLMVLTGGALMAGAQNPNKLKHYHSIRTIVTDLNGDDKPDTIKLSSSIEGSDFFNKISIAIAGRPKRTFYAKDEWTTVDDWFLDSNKNAISSKLLFLKKTSKHAVILLFGVLDGAGYRGEFSIINIEDNNIKMVFDHTDSDVFDVEAPVKLIDLEGNGRLCFLYRCLTECVANTADYSICGYNPFYVFPVDDSCRLSKPLMRQYNEQHYIFAGYYATEGILIRSPTHGGKRTIFKKPKS